MRRVLYRVASSLDGYIEGPRGEIDWIVQDPTVNWASLYAGTLGALMGTEALGPPTTAIPTSELDTKSH